MAYNTKPIVSDIDGNPISQYYNESKDVYEPVQGSHGANKVIIYNEDGVESTALSLIPILDKLSQLTGTILDEDVRKSNELQRIAFYDLLQQMLTDGEFQGEDGLQGVDGKGLLFNWIGTNLGVKVEGQSEFVYVDLKGAKGDTGTIGNLNSTHVTDALGYVPADEDIVGMLANLTTDEKANLVSAINEIKSQSNETATDLVAHKAESVTDVSGAHGLIYEEGTWTPDFTATGALTVNLATYTRIKNLVYCQFNVTVDRISTGTPRFVGFPFAQRSIRGFIEFSDLKDESGGKHQIFSSIGKDIRDSDGNPVTITSINGGSFSGMFILII